MSTSVLSPYYTTPKGRMYLGKCEDVIEGYLLKRNHKKVNLVFTSPPFPLNRAKKYGNMNGEEYLAWLSGLSKVFKEALTPDGSIVIELGNAWETGSPTQSTLPLEALLEFKRKGNLHFCQEFIYYNPAKLPSPVEWVNKKRIRVKDSFTRIWWLSNTAYPKANNRNVLQEYSKQMKKLLSRGKYNSGQRPSEYNIGDKSFSVNNGGSIPSNVIIASNTVANDHYIRYCKDNLIDIHPARMPKEIAEFFIKFLTEEKDLVLDPFAGSNTTGFVSEKLNRNWISIETTEKYIQGSIGRFSEVQMNRGV